MKEEILTPFQQPVKTRLEAARELMCAGDHERARTEAARAWYEIVAAPGVAPRRVVETATLYAFLELSAGRFAASGDVLDYARSSSGGHPNLDLLAGVRYERMSTAAEEEDEARELLRSARDAFLSCLARRNDAFEDELLPGAVSWAANTRLGVVELALGSHHAALEAFEAALDDRLDDATAIEVGLGRLEAWLELGRAPAVLAALEPWLAGDSPDAWALAARAAQAVGSTEDESSFCARALAAAETRPWISPRRARWVDGAE